MQGDLSTRNRTQKLKKAQPTQNISRRIEDREERAAKKTKKLKQQTNQQHRDPKKTAKFRGSRS
jgi:hypothetical protein